MTLVPRTPQTVSQKVTRISALMRQQTGRMCATLALWRHRSSERSQLAFLLSALGPDFVLHTGISRSEARAEAKKPFWKT